MKKILLTFIVLSLVSSVPSYAAKIIYNDVRNRIVNDRSTYEPEAPIVNYDKDDKDIVPRIPIDAFASVDEVKKLNFQNGYINMLSNSFRTDILEKTTMKKDVNNANNADNLNNPNNNPNDQTQDNKKDTDNKFKEAGNIMYDNGGTTLSPLGSPTEAAEYYVNDTRKKL